ncbi:MAG: pyridoxal phosphate-dependent aminotransferase [Deltaproteobacteria bacterium]|nr:pyridoxal phosphate-dependent aminotransferase [Deltaproteobacteria bacterium]
MPALSPRALAIPPSPTLDLDTQAKALKAQGLDVVNLSIGEPDYPTPANVCQAAIEAIKEGFTRYTPTAGIGPLREAISQKLKKDNNLDYAPESVVVAAGGKHALYNAFMCLCQPGDEVIIPSPHWVTYPAQSTMVGAIPVLAPTDPETLLLTPEGLKKALSPRSRVLVLNSPSNPSGRAYGANDLEKLAPLIKAKDLWVISDDIYENLIYDGLTFVNLPMVCPELKDQTVICHGVSKTYSMTGWRIGWLAGPKIVAQAAANLQGHMTSNASSVAQRAALAALTGPSDEALRFRAGFNQRRLRILELLAKIPGFQTPTPNGAFYVFPKVSQLLGRELGGAMIHSADDLARVILEKTLVATTPGTGFGAPDRLRLSYAVDLSNLEKALNRIASLVAGRPVVL